MGKDNPKINGNVHDYSSVTIAVDGEEFYSITEINYATKLSAKKVMGTHSEALGRTRGQREDTCDFSMYLYDWHKMRNTLGAGFMEKSFDIVVVYSEEKEAPLITDKILSCRITEVSNSPSEGDEPLKVKLTIDPMRITYNGLEALDKPLPAHA